jgi:hypothetical protein
MNQDKELKVPERIYASYDYEWEDGDFITSKDPRFPHEYIRADLANTRHNPPHETVEAIIKKADKLIEYVIYKPNRKDDHYNDIIACLALYLKDEIEIFRGKPLKEQS